MYRKRYLLFFFISFYEIDYLNEVVVICINLEFLND